MKRVRRWARLSVVIMLVAIGLAFITRDYKFRRILEREISLRTGCEAKIMALHSSFFPPRLALENLILYNPAKLGHSVLADIPVLTIETGLGDALTFHRTCRLHCRRLVLDLRGINVIQDKDGAFNVNGGAGQTTLSAAAKPSTTVPGRFKFTGIDSLDLSLDKIAFTRLKPPRENDELHFAIRHQMFTNVSSSQDLSELLNLLNLRQAGAQATSDKGPTSNPVREWLDQFFEAPGTIAAKNP